MDRWPTLRRVVLHAATVASPGLLVLLLLLVLGVIAPGVAALALAVVLLATAVLVWPYVLGVDSLQVAVDRLERHGDSPGPDTGPSESLRRVWDAVRRMHHEKEQGRRAVEQRLQAEEAILTALPDPLLLIDPARRVVRANAAAAELFGGSRSGATWRPRSVTRRSWPRPTPCWRARRRAPSISRSRPRSRASWWPASCGWNTPPACPGMVCWRMWRPCCRCTT